MGAVEGEDADGIDAGPELDADDRSRRRPDERSARRRDRQVDTDAVRNGRSIEPMAPRPDTHTDADADADPYGFDGSRNVVTDVLGKFVPQRVARRGLAVTVDTDRDTYAAGDPVELRIVVHNRLPVPVTVATRGRRLWGWAVDGELEGSDERRPPSDAPGSFAFRANERKVLDPTWNGLLRREDAGEWVPPTRGVHEISAFVATSPPRPRDAVRIRIE